MGLAYDPQAHAAQLGIEVVEKQLQHRRHGAWDNRARCIYLSPHLSRRERRVALAHEIQHAIVHDERPPGGGIIVARQECLAVKRAISMLIDHHEYADAERVFGPHPGVLAYELDVTVSAIRAFRRLQELRWPD